MQDLKIDDEATFTVTSLAHGGAGVGRDRGFVIFVPLTAPGDLVKARITGVKKNYAEGELIEVITPSTQRQQAPCPVFGECGGCQWQHVTYAEQLRQKQLIVEHALTRIAKEEGVTVSPIMPSPKPFHYRNRAQFRTEGPHVGFYKRHTHEIVNFDKCHIIDERLNTELSKIKTEHQNDELYRTSKVEVFLDKKGGVHRSLNRAHGEELGFSQVNTEQNARMQAHLGEILGKPSKVDSDNLGYHGNILDLYCGNGNFSLPLNQQGWRIYGVDMNKAAIQSARAAGNQETFFSFGDCSREVAKLASKNRRFEAVVLDPPRIGADERLWKNLEVLKPEKLVYISCNPATFARDWARFKNQSPMKLVSIQPFDMFPQTFHVELVALAIR